MVIFLISPEIFLGDLFLLFIVRYAKTEKPVTISYKYFTHSS